MRERAYAGYLSAAAASDLVAAGVAAHLDAVERKASVAEFLVSVGVRPDSACSAAVSLAASGIDDVHIVHVAVVVVVVLRIVHETVGQRKGVVYEFVKPAHVVASASVGTVVGAAVGQLHRPDNVKRGTERTVGTGHVEVAHTAVGTVLIGEALLVEHVGVEVVGVVAQLEVLVAERYEYHERVRLADSGECVYEQPLRSRRSLALYCGRLADCRSRRLPPYGRSLALCCRRLLACGGEYLHDGCCVLRVQEGFGVGFAVAGVGGHDATSADDAAFQCGILIVARGFVEKQRTVVGCESHVSVLVAAHGDGDERAVCLPDAPWFWVGRNSNSCLHEADSCQKRYE